MKSLSQQTANICVLFRFLLSQAHVGSSLEKFLLTYHPKHKHIGASPSKPTLPCSLAQEEAPTSNRKNKQNCTQLDFPLKWHWIRSKVRIEVSSNKLHVQVASQVCTTRPEARDSKPCFRFIRSIREILKFLIWQVDKTIFPTQACSYTPSPK